MLSFFPLDVLDEIWDLIGPVSEGFRIYFYCFSIAKPQKFERKQVTGTISILRATRTDAFRETQQLDTLGKRRDT